MNEEIVQLVGLVVLIVYELYSIRLHDYPIFAAFWDAVARFAGAIANFFANIAMSARLSYYEAIA